MDMKEVRGRDLVVRGKIPHWLSGTLVRNGPVTVAVDGKTAEHWFDGLAMLHAFSLHKGQVIYTNRFLRTDAYTTVFKKRSLNYEGFATDPCRSLFRRFLTFFTTEHLHNANVNVAHFAKAYVAMTELPLPIQFDRNTLETLGVFDYQDRLPKKQCWESAHPHEDLERGEQINYVIRFGAKSEYLVYRIRKGSATRELIGKIPVDRPAYMHSFALTQNYILFTEFPFRVRPIDLLVKGAFIKNFHWHPEEGTTVLLIDRQSGRKIRSYQTQPFFSFHHANAFEEKGRIHLDMVVYPDPNIITSSILSKEKFFERGEYPGIENYPARLERLSLDLASGRITHERLFDRDVEFPRLNSRFDGKSYCYLYLSAIEERALYKVNVATKETLQWEEEGCIPGEPVFVSFPNTVEEDEGVIFSLIFNPKKNSSFLLLLEGKSFKEIARAEAPHIIPPGLHGQYFER